MGVFAIKRKDGSKAWYYSFMYNGVRYRKLGGSTKTQALLTMEKVRNSVFNEDYGLVEKVKNPRIEDFAKTFLERRKHIRSYKRDALSVRILLRYFIGKTMHSISSASIEDYIHSRKASGVSNSTINRELACLKRMYNLAIRWKEARINPVTEIDFLEEPPGRTRFLSLEEAKHLIEKASNPCWYHSSIACINSCVFLSGSHFPVSGYAHFPTVSGFKSSNIPCTILELGNSPYILIPFQILP